MIRKQKAGFFRVGFYSLFPCRLVPQQFLRDASHAAAVLAVPAKQALKEQVVKGGILICVARMSIFAQTLES
jgi:hypothetical protein